MDYKLLAALNTIKEECKKHNDCNTCPMKIRHNNCGLDESSPDEWRLEPHTVYF